MDNTVAPIRLAQRSPDRRVRELARDAVSVMAFSAAMSLGLLTAVVVVTRLVP